MLPLMPSPARPSPSFSVHETAWFCVDSLGAASVSDWDPAAPFDDAADVGGHSLAFLQYTSGSTGAPKGVMVS